MLAIVAGNASIQRRSERKGDGDGIARTLSGSNVSLLFARNYDYRPCSLSPRSLLDDGARHYLVERAPRRCEDYGEATARDGRDGVGDERDWREKMNHRGPYPIKWLISQIVPITISAMRSSAASFNGGVSDGGACGVCAALHI